MLLDPLASQVHDYNLELFLYKNDIFRLSESKKSMKICSKTHQIAPFKNIFRGSMPPNFPNKRMATPRVASLPPKKNSCPPLGKSCIRT